MADPLSGQGEGSSGAAVRSGTLWSDLPRSMRGYESAATEALLSTLASKQADLERVCSALRDRATLLEADLAEHRRREQLVSKALLDATNHATMIRENAREEAESILRKAHAELENRAERAERAERDRAEADRELIRLRSLAEELKTGLARILSETIEQLHPEGESLDELRPEVAGALDAARAGSREALVNALEGALRHPVAEPHSDLSP